VRAASADQSASASIAGIMLRCREPRPRARTRLPHRNNWHCYSITSSAVARRVIGIVNPITLAEGILAKRTRFSRMKTTSPKNYADLAGGQPASVAFLVPEEGSD
jgi:hypothetical protein